MGETLSANTLYYGDNLDILRRYIEDDSVKLIYLDPPFKSNQDYNVLFAEQDGSRSAAQIKAFEDTWRWDQGSARAYQEVVEAGGRPSQVMQAFRTFLGENDMLAYLSMMAPRLVELRRVLKPRGSIYLHCDPTASHYLKMLMDAVFDPRNIRNEIIWQRTSAHSDARQGAQHFGRIHDVLLFYSKTDEVTWNPQHVPHDEDYVRVHYPYTEKKSGRRYGLWDVTGPGGAAKGNPYYEIFGVKKYWRYSQVNMEQKIKEGRVIQPRPGAVPREIRYLDESSGIPVGSLWTDIPPINSQAAERLGYPTQKPEALMDRIIQASSNEGDSVLDPFCGCGTTVASAQRLNRRWMGIDITYLAITLIRHRLHDAYGSGIQKTYKVIGEPVDLAGAAALAEQDPYQFQWWALGLVGARPVDVSHVRDLRGVLDREHAQIGVLLSLNKPTPDMRAEAASVAFYDSPWGKRYPGLQLLTIEDLLAGKRIDYPPSTQVNVTFKKAPKAHVPKIEQMPLGMVAETQAAFRVKKPKRSKDSN